MIQFTPDLTRSRVARKDLAIAFLIFFAGRTSHVQSPKSVLLRTDEA